MVASLLQVFGRGKPHRQGDNASTTIAHFLSVGVSPFPRAMWLGDCLFGTCQHCSRDRNQPGW